MGELRKYIVFYIVLLTVILASCIPKSGPMAVDDCTHYVDNQAALDGSGSLDTPWDNIAGHVDDLVAGDVMCVRGETSPPGRVHSEAQININSDTCANGTAESPITIRAYPGEHVILRRAGSSQYLIQLTGVAHWHFDGLTIDGQETLRFAIRIFDESSYNVVRNCQIQNIRFHGIDIASSDHNIVEYCEIHDIVCQPGHDAHGVILTHGSDNTFRNNVIYDITGDCIRLWPDDNLGNDTLRTVIENNHLYTTLGKCSENGIDMGNEGSPSTIAHTTIRGNTMHGFRYCDGSCGGTGGGIGAAILLHGIAEDVLIEGNEIYDSASGIAVTANDVQIVNNVIHHLATDPATWANIGIYVHHSRNVDIPNNTLADIPHNVLWFGPGIEHLNLYNNLAYNTNQIQNEHSASEVTADYNGWFSAADMIVGANDIAGDDPLLTIDYRLTENSPARLAGENGIDLGAFPYESGAETATPPPASSPTPTAAGEWWENCPPCPTYLIQPTYTPEWIPTCRPCQPSPTVYPTYTPYPVQPGD